MVNIFDFFDYKQYLKSKEAESTGIQRGFRSRLAEVLECQNAYISQVLNTHNNFSLEQALKISHFLKLNEIERRYFLLLIEHSRAGNEDLKEYFKKDITKLRSEYYNLIERITTTNELSLEQKNIYYSSWIYPMVHATITISRYNTKDKIAEALKLDETIISEVILFLVSTGLINEKHGVLSSGSTQIHLSRDSTFINQHHTCWRISAINSLAGKNKDDIHYSTLSSLSYDDAEKLKVKFLDLIQEYTKTIAPSKEETIYNFNLDFYCLLKKIN